MAADAAIAVAVAMAPMVVPVPMTSVVSRLPDADVQLLLMSTPVSTIICKICTIACRHRCPPLPHRLNRRHRRRPRRHRPHLPPPVRRLPPFSSNNHK